MNFKNSQQSKMDIKKRLDDFMQSYERSKAEEDRHKQEIKKNVMFEIISNRVKSQNETQKQKSETEVRQNTFKTMFSDVSPTDRNDIPSQEDHYHAKNYKNEVTISLNKQPQSHQQSRVEETVNENDKIDAFEEITFNLKKRNKSLEEELSYKFNKSSLAELTDLQNKKEAYEMVTNPPKNHTQLIRQNHNHQNQNQYHLTAKITNNSQLNASNSSSQLNSNLQKSSIPKNSSTLSNLFQQQQQDSKHEHEPEIDEIQDRKSQPQEEEDAQRGVFLTMEEEESYNVSEVPKNYTFEIKMDKSIPIENLEQMKKQKIRELQKKRQQRIQQFRRNESQKKVDIPKSKNSHALRKIDQTENQNINTSQLPVRSSTIQRKSQYSKHSQIPKATQAAEFHESQYGVKQVPSKPPFSHNLNQNTQIERQSKLSTKPYNQFNHQDDRQIKPISPFRTPKTILSQNNRGKSTNKNTIFNGESPSYPRQKSANRFNEPKIEPKDRKNSFSKQSNKKLMINAITYVCFPGELNRRQRQKLIDVLQTSEHQFFIFLFKQYSRKIIKGIYILDSNQTRLQKIYGDKAPFEITSQNVKQFYRFDSGSRQFKKVDGCKSFSLAIHAIDIIK